MISLIAAIGKNNELGKNNQLLWNMPADMKHFRDTTRGHTVIMGRKTFESIGKPLPNRKNIIITRDKTYLRHGVDVVHSLDEAIKLTKVSTTEEIFIIGGAEIYKQGIAVADKLYITHVNANFPEADTFFPEIIPILFLETSKEEHKKDRENPSDYTFSIYERF